MNLDDVNSVEDLKSLICELCEAGIQPQALSFKSEVYNRFKNQLLYDEHTYMFPMNECDKCKRYDSAVPKYFGVLILER